MGIKHTFVSAVADGADATLVRPSNWNEDHTIDADIDFSGFDLLVDDNTGIGSTEAGNPELLYFESVASAVNYLKITNSATGAGPSYSAAGDDANVGLTFAVKGTGASSPTSALIPLVNAGTANQASFAVKNTSAGNTGPGIIMFADSASPASDDYPGAFEMWGRDSANNAQLYGAIWAHVVDATSTSEDGELFFYTTIAGSTYRVPFCVGNGAIVGTSSDITYPGIGNLGIASGSFIKDEAANEFLGFTSAASAVNYLQLTNSATGNGASLLATGSDAAVPFLLGFRAGGANVSDGLTLANASARFHLGDSYPEVSNRTNVANTGGGFTNDVNANAGVNDYLGWFAWNYKNSTGGAVSGPLFECSVSDPTAASEDDYITFKTNVNGSKAVRFSVADGFVFGSGTTYPGNGNAAFADTCGIRDSAGARLLTFDGIASAVRSFELRNADTSYANGWPSINAYGAEANIPMRFQAKGSPATGFRFEAGSGAGYTQFRCANASHGARFSCSWSTTNTAGGEVGTFGFLGSDSYGFSYSFGFLSGVNLDPTYGTGCTGGIYFGSLVNYSYQVEMSAFDGVTFGGTRLGPASGVFAGRGNVQFDDATGIKDFNGNEQLLFQQTASAVNYLEVTNAATGNQPTLSATGSDTDVGLKFSTKGVGALYFVSDAEFGSNTAAVDFNLGTTASGQFRIYNTETSGGGPILFVRNISSSPAAADEVGAFIFGGKDSAGNDQSYTTFSNNILDATSGSEDGEWTVNTVAGGSFANKLKVADGVIIGSTSVYPGAGNLRVTNIELGHDTDTTLSRSAAGVLAVEGTPVALTGKQTIWVPASGMTPRTTNGAAATTREINSITTSFLAFDQTTSEGAFFHVAFPKSWNEGTVTAQVFWTTTGGAAAETLEFEIRGGCFANDAAINVTGLGTAVAHTDTWIADDDVHVTAEGSAITLSNAAVDTVAWFEISRDVANDTLTADAELIGVKLFYTTDAGNDA